jgi:DNA mismatch endonuclease (patch repair protein)
MADIFSQKKRSEVMSRIRGRDTGIERTVRRALHAVGLRFRLHVGTLPGRPDIVLPRHRAAVFVHGCFWHGHSGCRLAVTPKTNTAFWREKIGGNRRRDAKAIRSLRRTGWRAFVVWECGISEKRLMRLAHAIMHPRGPEGTSR